MKPHLDPDLCSLILDKLIAYNQPKATRLIAWLDALNDLEQLEMEHPAEYKKAVQVYERNYKGWKERRNNG